MRRVFTLTAVVAFTGACATQTLIGEEALDASETPDASNVPDVSHAPDAFPVEAPAARLLPELGDGGGAVVPAVDTIYAIGADTGSGTGIQSLYSYNPKTKALTVIGPLSGPCVSDAGAYQFAVDSMAIGASSNAYVVGVSPCDDYAPRLWKLDLTTAAMTIVGDLVFSEPTPETGVDIAISFVPKGTVDPESESLVGYAGFDPTQYVQINTTTADTSVLGTVTLPSGAAFIAGMTSVIGGGAFATYFSDVITTVLGTECNALGCLLQVDPKTGAILQNYGDVLNNQAYGVAYYEGDIYCFPTDNDLLVAVGWQMAGPVTSTIPLAEFSHIQFVASASGTNVPVSSPDGGVPPLK